MNDLRFAFRQLLKNPGFTAVAVLLALGIGANTVVFSVAKAVLLRPLGLVAPDRLMWIRFANNRTGSKEERLYWRDFQDIRGTARSFESGLPYSGQPTPPGNMTTTSRNCRPSVSHRTLPKSCAFVRCWDGRCFPPIPMSPLHRWY